MHPYMRFPRQTWRSQQNPYKRSQYYQEEHPVEENEAPDFSQANEQDINHAQNNISTETAPEVEAVAPASNEAEEKAKAELEEEKLRMAAEMDNFKKRLNREFQDKLLYASEKVLSDLLPALDNLDLAIQYGNRHEACKDMMQGIEMTRKQLLDAVAKNGLTLIGQRAEPFNPEIHEAIGMENDPELENGAVTRVLQNGYKLNDRLMRPAKVMVNQK